MIARMMQWLGEIFFSPRSGKWEALKDEYLREHPACIVCGNATRSQLTAHHRIPFHVEPSLELDKNNLLTMCRDDYGYRCHLIFGHCGSYVLWNSKVDAMAKAWQDERLAAKKRYHDHGHL